MENVALLDLMVAYEVPAIAPAPAPELYLASYEIAAIRQAIAA